MLLDDLDLKQYYRLYFALQHYMNEQLKVTAERYAGPVEFSHISPTERLQIRDAGLQHLELVDAFVAENPRGFNTEDLEIVRSWREPVVGAFYLMSQLKKHAIFLSESGPAIAYGVLALFDPFATVVPAEPPALVKAVLLPFKNRIVYDGLLINYRISFGPGIRRSLKERLQLAKTKHGIVEQLPLSIVPLPAQAHSNEPQPRLKAKARSQPQAGTDKTAAVVQSIIGLIEPFCQQHLNAEYAGVCRKLTEKLGRKRPSPLLSGNPHSWASGIVRSIGWVNFLSDKSQTPHMLMSDIDAAFGISESTGATKSLAIRKLLKIRVFDPEWTLPSRLSDIPQFPQIWFK